MDACLFQFEWDEAKASVNAKKHGVTFELPSPSFQDPRLLKVADLEHSETEERWFSVGCARTMVMSVVYLWPDIEPAAPKSGLDGVWSICRGAMNDDQDPRLLKVADLEHSENRGASVFPWVRENGGDVSGLPVV